MNANLTFALCLGVLLLSGAWKMPQNKDKEDPKKWKKGKIAPEIHIFGQESNKDFVRIPFRLNGGLMMIEAELEGKRGIFILDSGAPDLVLNQKYVDESVHKADNSGGIGGNVERVSVKIVSDFRWAGQEWQNYRVDCISLQHLEASRNETILGLIGYQMFAKFELHLNYSEQYLTLYFLDKKGDKSNPALKMPEPKAKVGFQVNNNVILLKAQVGEKKLLFGLDTGSEVNILDIRLNQKVLQHFSISRRAVVRGTSRQGTETLVGYLNHLQIEQVLYKNMKTILVDMSSLSRAYGVKIQGLLGYAFLVQKQVAFNFKKKEMYIWEKSSQLIADK